MGKSLLLKSAEEHCEKSGAQVLPQRPQLSHKGDCRLDLGTRKGVLNNMRSRPL